jgi:DNA polymerase-3 subunit epsilon
MHSNANSLVILDFETTGLSPNMGDRAIEIGAVRIKNGVISDRFQALMDPGFAINGFIENYTGITNAMLKKAPPCAEVMHDFVEYIGDDNLVAHNASFDQRFLDAELSLIAKSYRGDFACSLLLSRRLFPSAPDHKLGTLIKYKNIETNGQYHRALFDSEMTTQLWLTLLDEISAQTGSSEVLFSLVKKLAKTPKAGVAKLLQNYA